MHNGRVSDAPRTLSLRLPAATARLVVLGDPHGDLIALDEVLRREQRPDTAIVSAGDNIGYADGGSSSHLCAALAARNIPSVRGNHEVWSEDAGRLFLGAPGLPNALTDETWAWIAALPDRIELTAEALPRARLSVRHCLPDWAYVNRDNAERLLDIEDAHVAFCGHTHRPAIYTIRRGRRTTCRRLDPRGGRPLTVRREPGCRYVVDAGSLARPAGPRGGRPLLEWGTYAVFDLRADTLELRAVDKRPLFEALLRRMSEPPPPSP